MKHKAEMKRPNVDLNQQAVEFSTPSTPSPVAQEQEQEQEQEHVHNFTPNTPFLLTYQQETKEGKDKEEDRNSCLTQKQKQSIDLFWNQQLFEIYNTTAFKSNRQLPLARIKRVMKANREVKMIGAETPIVFAKACELFIQELTLRAWLQTEERKRRTLEPCDIARALKQDEVLNFLVTLVPFNSHQDDESDNSPEEINELHPANKLYFPAVDINGKSISNHHEGSQPLTIKPSLPVAEFNCGSTSQLWKAVAEENVTEKDSKFA